MSPFEFGVLDGLYQGVTAVARLAAGVVADTLAASFGVHRALDARASSSGQACW